jgi:transcription antitermination factor NusG
MNSLQGRPYGYTPAPDGRSELENHLLTRQWFAVYTLPQNERWILRQLEARQVEAFLPTYEVTKVWKNRQRVTLARPLFPAYLFVHVDRRERVRVLEVSGVLSIVGNSRGPLPLDEAQIEHLRSDICRSRLEPFGEIAIGTRVRVKKGPMYGVQGILVHRKNSFRLVVTIDLINQSAALEIAPEDVEPILPGISGPSWRFGLPETAC